MKQLLSPFTTVVLLVILLGIGFFLWSSSGEPTATNPGATSTSTAPGTPASKDDMIVVDTPLPNSVIASPLTVTGRARGGWYFEASFPVKVLDANGNVLAAEPAQAQGNWMTAEYVPFTAQLTFLTPSTPTGFLVLEKDNPSGLPQNADELRIPIRFNTQGSAGDTHIQLYFYDYNLDHSMCSVSGLVAVDRTITKTTTPLKASIELLLSGQPSISETNQGLVSLYPQSGVTLKSATIENGVATLTLNDPQNQLQSGSCKVSVMRIQIEKTAQQFPTVQSVKILPETLFQP